jgi:hypothetical protein
MICIRKKVLLSFCIFLITLMMCVSGTFSYAEDEDYSQGFYAWQTIVAEKWAQFEKLDLDSEGLPDTDCRQTSTHSLKCRMSRMTVVS